ncbi:hypothetical protein V1264_016461 [Littorina saxatilis]|uniref:Uncharacterized protein n=1 Tax=Littorina saxatilis TaxID=31220 RepID=A0AAN9BP53_9CAEN
MASSRDIFFKRTPYSTDPEANTCLLRKGKKLRTFGNTNERVKIPCKYHAISATRCGNYKVTVTPGNAIEADKDKRYIVKTMYVGVERISDGMKWEGRSDLKIAEKYLDGAKDAPFIKKDGALNTSEVFNFGPTTQDDQVTLIAKDGSFHVIFSLYEAGSTWQKRSGFQFDCLSADFEPSDYPDQLCGNGTKHEAATFKSDNGFQDRRQATTFYNVFMNQGLAQTDSDCKTTADTMAKKCDGFEYEAAQKCWKIVGRKRFQKCITQNLETPESAMRHCVEYVCSNYTDPNSCHALSDELDGCQNLVGISERVKAHCAPYLSIKF